MRFAPAILRFCWNWRTTSGVELALDVAEDTLPAYEPVADLLAARLCLSPLAWSLGYQFPVHRIGPGFRPTEAQEPTYLVVYRDREDVVHFVEANAATARLLELIAGDEPPTVRELLRQLAGELGLQEAAVAEFGAAQLDEFLGRGIVLLVNS